jgi:uncharacterized protein (TIGR01777 family)
VRIAIGGSHGLIGSALIARLSGTHDVVRLPRAGTGTTDLDGVDAVVNLSGAGIGDKRWTDARRREIETSRIDATAALSSAIAGLERRPAVLISASAVGYYGDRGGDELTESAAPGTGFLASLCQRWEAATSAASDAGVRVVHVRSGIVLAPSGGALGRQVPLFRLGLGGRLGSGRQWVSWIALEDEVRAIEFLLTAAVDGAVNLTSPLPATNAELTAALARALRRPAKIPVPAVALRLALGTELADELVLASQRAVPAALHAAGFSFRYPTIDAPLRHTFG